MSNRKVDLVAAGSGDKATVYQDISNLGDCPFCGPDAPHVDHPHPVTQHEYWRITRNRWPYEGAVYQFVIIYRDHVVFEHEVSPEAWIELFHKIIPGIRDKYELTGYGFYMRIGACDRTHASVVHIHANIIVGDQRSPDFPLDFDYRDPAQQEYVDQMLLVPLGYKKRKE